MRLKVKVKRKFSNEFTTQSISANDIFIIVVYYSKLLVIWIVEPQTIKENMNVIMNISIIVSAFEVVHWKVMQ